MNSEIKAVLFDYGNVLSLQHYKSDLEAMAKCLGSDLERLTNAYWEFRDDFDQGIYHGAEYWTKIAARCKTRASEEQLLRLIELDNIGWTRPNEVIVEWAARLRTCGIKTAIVSNMPRDIREYLHSVKWLPEFDHYSFSCELSSLKPDSKIYQHTLEAIQEVASEVLFLDDRVVNVNAAKALGMHAFVFADHDSLQEYLLVAGLPTLNLNISDAIKSSVHT